MIWYCAGCSSSLLPCATLLANHGIRVPALFTYAELHRERILEQALRYPGPRFLDSGAFTVATRGAAIRLADYIAFCTQYADHFGVMAALDVIGNEDATWVNYCEMLAAGLRPIPTWHITSSPRALRRVVEAAEHFAIGGMVGMNTRLRYKQLRTAWDIIYECNPAARVHGFGLTRVEDLLAFPWYSVDSSSQIRGAGFGQALVVENNRIATVASTDRGQGACSRRLSTSMLTTLASMAAITEHWQRHTYIVGRGCTHNARGRE